MYEVEAIDDKTVDDNKDLYKIIGTIKTIIYDFTTFYRGKFVFFVGSTPARTRLFRMILSNNIESFNKDFRVYSVAEDKDGLIKNAFKKGVVCLGFVIKRKRLKPII